MRSFQSNENIHKKEGGTYYVVLANKASSVTLLSPGNESTWDEMLWETSEHFLQRPCDERGGSQQNPESRMQLECMIS